MTAQNPLTMLELMRARVMALLDKHDLTVTGIARDMGQSHTWLLRKMQAKRPLSVSDLDAVLQHLGEPVDVIMEPVLIDIDFALLGKARTWTDANPGHRRKLAEDDEGRVIAGVRRLRAEGLIKLTKPLVITDEGRAVLDAFNL